MNGPPIPTRAACVVVVLPSWVGDTVMATPVLRAVRAERPEARLVGVMRPGLEALLAGTPWLDELVPARPKGLAGPWRVARLIRERRPDAALLLPNSMRAALIAWLAGAPRRIGYDRDGRGRLLTHRLPVEAATTPTSTLLYYARLGAWALGGDGIEPRMELAVTDEEESAADALLAGIDGPFVLLNPGGNKPAKRWPAERFGAVAGALAEAHGLSVAVSGAPAEAAIVRAVVASIPARSTPVVVDLAARGVTLGALKAVMRRAALLITNDTGPRHIAAALGTPVVSLFGPTDARWTALPGVREQVLLADPFLPEELVADAHPRQCAIDRITIADVLAAARGQLASAPRSARPGPRGGSAPTPSAASPSADP